MPGKICMPGTAYFFGFEVHIDAEPAALGPTGYRPLRMRDTLF
ncbi:hypothetical protein [Nocardia sp. NPDC050412]